MRSTECPSSYQIVSTKRKSTCSLIAMARHLDEMIMRHTRNRAVHIGFYWSIRPILLSVERYWK